MSTNFWNDKRVVVTGGAGFLGSFVLEGLIQHARVLFRDDHAVASINAGQSLAHETQLARPHTAGIGKKLN